MTPIALTIAGSDSGGGAGIQADLKTFSALGVYGTSVLAALTAQNTMGVQGVHAVPADFVGAQMRSVLSDIPVNAIKIGMLATPDVIRAVAAELPDPLADVVVLDPVMVAQSGDPLLAPEAVKTLLDVLVPKARLITPNLHEAARLLGTDVATNESDMLRQGETLIAAGARAVLMKGGHGAGPESVDLLLDGGEVDRFTAPRIPTENTHGTGCTLSSAIAAHLARGFPLVEAVGRSKAWLTEAIRAADTLRIGQGHGPVHHFHALWRHVS